jgi:hypothetical protein
MPTSAIMPKAMIATVIPVLSRLLRTVRKASDMVSETFKDLKINAFPANSKRPAPSARAACYHV